MNKEPKKALVLSGGSIRGAFQAGAVKAVLENGFQPDIIQGISAGALNASFLASESGKMRREFNQVDWSKVGENLYDLWSENIRKPQDILQMRNWLSIGWSILSKKFDGLANIKPLRKLVNAHIKAENINFSPVEFLIGAVNMESGQIEYKGRSDKDILNFVFASSAIPALMPLVKNDDSYFYDGGIRDTAPLRKVIEKGADEIVVILTQPKQMEQLEFGKQFQKGNIIHLLERTVNIVLNEILMNDLQEIEKVNSALELMEGYPDLLAKSHLKDKRKIKLKVIHPQKALDIKLDQFNETNIHDMLTAGYESGSVTISDIKPSVQS